MALYHLSCGFVSRSTGRSAVQSAAYITGEKLYESRRDLSVNYQNRHKDVAYTATLIPDHVPLEKREEFSSLAIWDTLESFEDTYAQKRFPHHEEAREKYLTSAQTAMTIVVALPRELSLASSLELVESFAKTRFVSRGLMTTVAIHLDEGNPHAHLQIARRAVDDKGDIAWAKDRQICTRAELLYTRKLWAEYTNQMLEQEGWEERITEKSFAALGVNLAPTQHRGWYADKIQEEKGIPSRLVLENERAFQENAERLRESPALILEEITSKQATFTQLHLLKALQKRVGDDEALVASLFEHALQESLVVGEGVDGQVRYTSTSYKDLENKACQDLEALLKDPSGTSSRKILPEKVSTLLKTTYASLSQEQKEAVYGLTQERSFSVLIGRAGAGKTTTLKAVADLYQEAGYHVIGTSLAALAAENLEKETGVLSATVESWLYRWETYARAQEKFLSFQAIMEEGAFKQLQWYKDLKQFEASALTDKHVVMVDEAGMIGTRQWASLLRSVQKAGAKLIAVGDDHQFKAIDAGDFFREMGDRAQEKGALYTLKTIRRQKNVWMREASQALADLHIQQGLSLYEKQGHLHETERACLEAKIASAYVQKITKGEEGLVLAFTNAQAQSLNTAIRRELQAQGKLGGESLLTLGTKVFSKGEKVVFLKNTKTDVSILDAKGTRLPQAFIKNGTTGFLESVNDGGMVTVRLTESQKAVFSKEAYQALAYGYALTTHKSQGQTVDFTLIAASKQMEAKGLYVAMTRHRHDVQFYYAKEDFRSFGHLTHHLSRFEAKDLVKDYTIAPAHEAAWQRVQEYRLCILEAAALLKEGKNEGAVDWKAYRQVKHDQITLGQEILSDFQTHKLYVEQAGLTGEMLEITTGRKSRPLSLAEEKAKMTVTLYGETAQLTRSFWKELQGKGSQNPSLTSQDLSQKFQDLRGERDALAKEILDHYPLHRPFMKELSKTYGITKRTLENQVAYRERDRERHKVREASQESTQKASSNTPHSGPQNSSDNFSYGKLSSCIGLEQGTSRDVPSKDGPQVYRRNSPYNATTATDIVSTLNSQIKTLAWDVMGKPTRQTPQEWRYGRSGSVSIHVAGTKQGLYSNFETGVSGNVITFIADQLTMDRKEAFKWGLSWLDEDKYNFVSSASKTSSPTVHDRQAHTSRGVVPQTWTPTYPVTVPYPDFKQEPHLRPLMRGRHEVDRFPYKDAKGHILGYVVRLEDKDGHKITPMLTYCRNDKGEHQWRWQGFGDNRPLYGLEKLQDHPKAPVLIVEGEKTCNAARLLFPDYVVLTWSGGCGAVQKSDWSVLKGREVTIFPDNDKPGRKAAHKIAEILLAHEQRVQEEKAALLPSQTPTSIKIVDLPASLPPKWDLADPLPKWMTGENLNILLQKAYTVSSSLPVQDKALEFTSLSPHHKERIDHIMKENRLNLSFGDLKEKDYHFIHQTAQSFKEIQSASGQLPHEDWILKRATFMVCYLKDQIHHTNLTHDETTRLALIASKQFADRNERGDPTSNNDAHFIAKGTCRELDKKTEFREMSSSQKSSLHREMYGDDHVKNLNTHDRTLSPAEASLKNLIHRIHNDYRDQYQLQEQKDRELRLLRQREKSL